MITPQNIFRHELVGLHVEVVKSSHEGFTGIKGIVVDETKNTIKVEDVNGCEKIIPKKLQPSVSHCQIVQLLKLTAG